MSYEFSYNRAVFLNIVKMYTYYTYNIDFVKGQLFPTSAATHRPGLALHLPTSLKKYLSVATSLSSCNHWLKS